MSDEEVFKEIKMDIEELRIDYIGVMRQMDMLLKKIQLHSHKFSEKQNIELVKLVASLTKEGV